MRRLFVRILLDNEFNELSLKFEPMTDERLLQFTVLYSTKLNIIVTYYGSTGWLRFSGKFHFDHQNVLGGYQIQKFGNPFPIICVYLLCTRA